MKMSARLAISCLRKSATIRRWPRSLCERFTRVASTGWLSAVFDPTIRTSAAFSMSAIEPLSPALIVIGAAAPMVNVALAMPVSVSLARI